MPREIGLDLLARLLPPTASLAAVRQGVLALSTADPARRWSNSAAYDTVDRRVVSADALDRIFNEAEQRSVTHVRSLHRAVRAALADIEAGNTAQAVDRLVELGEDAAAAARWEECAAYYDAVERLARHLDAASALILATRRLGRAHLHLGDVPQATRWYLRSLEHAELAADRAAVVTARIGLGHVLCVRGRWHDAEEEYSRGLALLRKGDDQLRGQLGINLSMTARERGELDLAARHLADAEACWGALSDADCSAWHNNHGMLCMARGDHDDAAAAFDRAFDAAPSHFDRAMILDNSAELQLRRGMLHEAESLARHAEDYAIAGASPRALADIYIRLGRIMAAKRDTNGIAFFEKALEIAADHGYTYTEALACTEYSRYRAALGDADEAAGLRHRARILLGDVRAPDETDSMAR